MAAAPDISTVNTCLIHNNLGILYGDMGRYEMARDEFTRAAGPLEDVLRRAPEFEPARYLLSGVYSGRAGAWTELGYSDEAVADSERALTLGRGYLPHLLPMVHAMFEARHQAKDPTAVYQEHYAEAMRELVTFASSHVLFGSTLYGFACVSAQASATAAQDERLPVAERTQRAGAYDARAVDCLQKAQASGYFREPGRVARLEKDPVLAPLRARADFQELLTQLRGQTPDP